MYFYQLMLGKIRNLYQTYKEKIQLKIPKLPFSKRSTVEFSYIVCDYFGHVYLIDNMLDLWLGIVL